MVRLENKTIEKLAKEGRSSNIQNPVSPEQYREINYKLIAFEKQNYEARFYSKKIILRA
jgi:hypothetical protein